MTGVFSLAVHAMVYLNHKKASVSSEDLAENICTNPARVRKVMAMLKTAELVSTKEGSHGGYTFTADPRSVTLRQIAKAVDAEFVESKWHSGSEDMDCLIASGMAEIMDGVYSRMNSVCLEQLEDITVDDIDRQIFSLTNKSK